jgi:hypothetical protein
MSARRFGRPALPVSVVCWRICDGHYGFRTAAERQAARRELEALMSTGSVFDPHFTFVEYRDTATCHAAQVIVWLPGQLGGFTFNGRRQLKSSITRKVVASLYARGAR